MGGMSNQAHSWDWQFAANGIRYSHESFLTNVVAGAIVYELSGRSAEFTTVSLLMNWLRRQCAYWRVKANFPSDVGVDDPAGSAKRRLRPQVFRLRPQLGAAQS